MKICTKCGIEKDETEFTKDSSNKDGLYYRCRDCGREYYETNREKISLRSKIYRNKNKEKKYQTDKEYRDKNKEKIAQQKKEYSANNKEKLSNAQKEYYSNNKEAISQQKKEYNQRNKEKVADRHREYAKKHKKEVNKYKDKYHRNKNETDPFYRFKLKIKRMVYYTTVYRKHFKKKNKTFIIIGCTCEELLSHLIKTAIENYGFYDPEFSYHVDHIVPIATAQTEEDVIKLNHYTNLQYLTPKDNLSKKDKLDWKINKPETKINPWHSS